MKKVTLIKIEDVNHLIKMSDKHTICYPDGIPMNKTEILNSKLFEILLLIKDEKLYAEAI
jgi:hypothetical protein